MKLPSYSPRRIYHPNKKTSTGKISMFWIISGAFLVICLVSIIYDNIYWTEENVNRYNDSVNVFYTDKYIAKNGTRCTYDIGHGKLCSNSTKDSSGLCKEHKPVLKDNSIAQQDEITKQKTTLYSDGYCQAYTKKGKRCKNKAQKGRNYCGKH